ncbi:hypothetical protein M0813_07053 [Anaeramoeba flamelloides]|uniref:Uncharacterized protein n=1 Tax=Anaeramoeba flamelloides TaxID=1746091 RepID=A0ABQ8XGK2_9EUKA|nr:hypothetical protein M0813_07053 [Anaeramoeba flamelloides]
MHNQKEKEQQPMGDNPNIPHQTKCITNLGPFHYQDVTLKELSEKITQDKFYGCSYSFYIPSKDLTYQNKQVAKRWVWCSSRNHYSCNSDLVAFLIHSSQIIPEKRENNYLGVIVTLQFFDSNCSIFVMKRKNGIRSRYSSKLMGLSPIVKSILTLTKQSQIPKVFWDLKQFDNYLRTHQKGLANLRKRQYDYSHTNQATPVGDQWGGTGKQEQFQLQLAEEEEEEEKKSQKFPRQDHFQPSNFQNQPQDELSHGLCRYPKRTRKLKKLTLDSNLAFGEKKKKKKTKITHKPKENPKLENNKEKSQTTFRESENSNLSTFASDFKNKNLNNQLLNTNTKLTAMKNRQPTIKQDCLKNYFNFENDLNFYLKKESLRKNVLFNEMEYMKTTPSFANSTKPKTELYCNSYFFWEKKRFSKTKILTNQMVFNKSHVTRLFNVFNEPWYVIVFFFFL